jgi:hypothetical protein
MYCNGYLRANGDGIIPCASNSDCTVLNTECPGNNCGTCSLSRLRDCFLDPIVALGEPGRAVAGDGCISRATSAGVNYAIGWPGPTASSRT